MIFDNVMQNEARLHKWFNKYIAKYKETLQHKNGTDFGLIMEEIRILDDKLDNLYSHFC